MASTAKLGLGLIDEGQVRAELTHNENMIILDGLWKAVVSVTSTPPGSPTDGDGYLVGNSPTGAWAGKADNIAIYQQGWRFVAPFDGLRVYSVADAIYWTYRTSGGASWRKAGPVGNVANVSGSFVAAEVNAIVTGLNSLLGELRTVGILKT